uniref:Thiamin pyrophosphokinase 1 n=1 Tax=Lygus hesperus TaxID=30085 RepID=A0A0A9WIU9_LYGHE
MSSTKTTGDAIEWSPLHPREPMDFSLGSYALMILNVPIQVPPLVVCKLWDGAVFRSTVDGGTDQWLKFLQNSKVAVTKQFPEIVSGDFDSILPETLASCRNNGCDIVETPDQNYTDFDKGLRALITRCKSRVDSVLVVCECTGRIDQTYSNINTLRLGAELPGNPSLYLLTSDSISWHLRRGKHIIHIPQHLRDKQQWCAILPFEPKESQITSTGLKWNLTSHCIKFGGLISSSNTYSNSETVTLDTDAELIWSMGL